MASRNFLAELKRRHDPRFQALLESHADIGVNEILQHLKERKLVQCAPT